MKIIIIITSQSLDSGASFCGSALPHCVAEVRAAAGRLASAECKYDTRCI